MLGFPVQVFKVGVTVIVELMDVLELFVAAKVLISALPFAARPILVLLFVQVKVPPAGVLVKFV